MKLSLSRPAKYLVIALTLLALALCVLWRLRLLSKLATNPAFQSIASVLAVGAIVFALVQFYRMEQHGKRMEDQSNRMEEQSKRMEEIAKSMSTRYIGHFPKNLEDLVKLVAAADRELLVLADCVDYGCYSSPEEHKEFLDEVMKARCRGVVVRFLVYGHDLATKALHQQFDPKDFDETKNSAQFKHYFDTYPGIAPPVEYDNFLKILRSRETLVKTELVDRGAKILSLPKEEQLFFWLEDDEDAVFSFENIGAGDPLCFRTRDAKLIETFRAIFERNWKAQEPPKLEVVAKTASA